MSGFVFVTARGLLRRQRAAYSALAVVVAIGGGAALGAAIAAERTDRAYPDYVRGAQVTDLVINPSLSTTAVDEAIRGFDGIASIHTNWLFAAGLGYEDGGRVSDLLNVYPFLSVIGSPDGRFVDVDRPAVTEGRVPSGDNEVFVSEGARASVEAQLGRSLAVGDSFNMSFFWTVVGIGAVDPADFVEPIGVESVRIAGIGYLSDEVLPDELYPRERMIVSGNLARKYGCVGNFSADLSDDEALEAYAPPNCSDLYRYFSLHLDDPSADASVRRQFEAAAAALTAELPPFIEQVGAGYYLIPQARADLDQAVQRAVQPTVTTLRLFALIALMATIAVFGIAVSRVIRRGELDLRTLHHLGATRVQQMTAAVLPAMTTVVLGAGGAVAVGAAVSPIGPIGSVRSLVSSPGISLPAAATIAVLVPLVLVLALVAAVIGLATTRARAATEIHRGGWSLLSSARRRLRRPTVATGADAALDIRRAGTAAALVGCFVTVVCLVGAAIFGGNLSSLVDSPARYGWPWDAAVITGSGYGDADPQTIASTLSTHADVESYSLYALEPSVQFDDQGVATIYGFLQDPPPSFELIEGRQPRNANETLLGLLTARSLGVGVGDRVTTISRFFGESQVEVVGIAVMPAVGPFVADRSGLGDGAFVLSNYVPGPGDAALIGINLRDGTDPVVVLDGMRSSVATWAISGEPPLTFAHAVRSPEIINVGELRSAPLLLGALLVAALVGGLAVAIVVSVRDRRRELAILRVLGFRDGELRASVRWQATVMMLVGVAIGVPLGVLAGRTAWRAFADELGVSPVAEVPLITVVAMVAGAMVLAIAASVGPALSVTRSAGAAALRER